MKLFKKSILFLIVFMMLVAYPTTASADVWEFGSGGDGGGNNPFVPRGYVIETANGSQHWLHSRFDNSTGNIYYTGSYNGVQYIDAVQEDGGGYKLYAMTDRNPLIYQYLLAYKNGQRIDIMSYVGAPGRLSEGGGLGSGAGWAIPITGFQFEPGSYYEFAFGRGMQANNGISLVLSECGRGYIRNPFTEAEAAKYERDKYTEYEFVSSYDVIVDPDTGERTFNINLVPMRFSVQTCADLTTWNRAADEVRAFIRSVTPADYTSGKYIYENILELATVLDTLQDRAMSQVRFELQGRAESLMQEMIGVLNQALDVAMTGITHSDLTVLLSKLEEARILYDDVKDNVGTEFGQYSRTAVDLLQGEINEASLLTSENPQSEIDAAIIRLDTAMIRVRASRVAEEMIILSDRATGVRIIASTASVPSDVNLFVRVMDEDSSEYLAYEDKVGGSDYEIMLYDIRLYSGDRRIQPSMDVEVQIPIAERFGNEEVSVHSVSPEGDYRTVSAATAAGYKLFKSDNIGLFSIIGLLPNDINEGENDDDADGNAEDSGDNETNDGEVTRVTIINETDIPLSESPLMEDTLDEVGGFDSRPISSVLGEVVMKEIPDSISVPLAELERGRNPVAILIFAGALTTIALLACVIMITRRKQRPVR